MYTLFGRREGVSVCIYVLRNVYYLYVRMNICVCMYMPGFEEGFVSVCTMWSYLYALAYAYAYTHAFVHVCITHLNVKRNYGVARISRLIQITGLFCRI